MQYLRESEFNRRNVLAKLNQIIFRSKMGFVRCFVFLLFFSSAYCYAGTTRKTEGSKNWNRKLNHGRFVGSLVNAGAKKHTAQVRYKNHKIGALSRPSCVSWGTGDVHCFYRGVNSTVHHFNVTNRGISQETSMEVETFNNVNCVSTAAGKMSCAFLSLKNTLGYISFVNGDWKKWVDLEELFNGIGWSSCTRMTDKDYTCVLLHSEDYAMQVHIKENEEYPAFESLGKNLTYRSSFSCLSRHPTTIDCIGVNHMNLLMDLQWNKSRLWNHGIGVGLYSGHHPEPSSLVLSNTTFVVFGVSQDNEMVVTRWNVTHEFLDPVTVGGLQVAYSPECIHVRDHIVYCFAVGIDGYLYLVHFSGIKWSRWKPIGKIITAEPPSCVLADPKKIYCLGRSGESTSSFEVTVTFKFTTVT